MGGGKLRKMEKRDASDFAGARRWRNTKSIVSELKGLAARGRGKEIVSPWRPRKWGKKDQYYSADREGEAPTAFSHSRRSSGLL